MTRPRAGLLPACLVFLCSCLPGLSQQPVYLNSETRKTLALNAYIDFSNECMHLLAELRPRLEQVNQAWLRPAGPGSPDWPVFSVAGLADGLDFTPPLRGVCARPPGTAGEHIPLRALYEATARVDDYLPAPARIAMNRQRDELMFAVISLLALADTLALISDPQRSAGPLDLERMLLALKACSEWYDAVQEIRAALHQLIRSTAPAQPPPVADLQAVLEAAADLVAQYRTPGLRQPPPVQLLRQALELFVAQRAGWQARWRALGVTPEQQRMAERHIEDYTRDLIRKSDAFSPNEALPQAYQAYGAAYYYYNERLLSLYNHHKYGMAAYYNRLTGFAVQPLLKQLELAPAFRWLPAPPPRQAQAPQAAPPAASAAPSAPDPLETAAVNHLVFLLDVSASMNKPEKLPLLLRSIDELLGYLRPEDRISLVVYSGEARVVLEAVSAAEQERIRKALGSLQSSGETQIRKGLRQAYRTAAGYYIPGGNNRVLLASDGGFDVQEPVAQLIGRMPASEIQLSVLLLGKFASERTLTQLRSWAEQGGGELHQMLPDNALDILIQEAGGRRE